MRTSSFTPELDQQLTDEYEAGATYRELAQKYGYSTTAIASATRRAGVKVRHGVRTLWQETSEMDAEVARLYLQGMPCKIIGLHFRTRPDNILASLKRSGIQQLRPGGAANPTFRTIEQCCEIQEKYETGISLKRLAQEYGCSTTAIKRAIKQAGSKLRSPGLSRIWTDEAIDWAVEEFLAGRSQQSIGDELGVHQTSVSMYLRKAGVLGRAERPRGAADHGSWKGGRVTTTEGYIWIKVDLDDPFFCMANIGGYIPEHRLVLARHYNRPLLSTETVHHINGKHDDNRLENLQLRQGNHGKGIIMTCRNCGSHDVQATPLAEEN